MVANHVGAHLLAESLQPNWTSPWSSRRPSRRAVASSTLEKLSCCWVSQESSDWVMTPLERDSRKSRPTVMAFVTEHEESGSAMAPPVGLGARSASLGRTGPPDPACSEVIQGWARWPGPTCWPRKFDASNGRMAMLGLIAPLATNDPLGGDSFTRGQLKMMEGLVEHQ